MSEAAEQLAARLATANDRVIDYVQSCTEEEWQRLVESEGRPVKTVIRHIAGGYRILGLMLRAMVDGIWVPLTHEAVDANNAAYDAQASYTPAEALEKLRHNAAQLATTVGALSDAELSRTTVFYEGNEPWTIAEFIERNGIGHAEDHLAGITAGR